MSYHWQSHRLVSVLYQHEFIIADQPLIVTDLHSINANQLVVNAICHPYALPLALKYQQSTLKHTKIRISHYIDQVISY